MYNEQKRLLILCEKWLTIFIFNYFDGKFARSCSVRIFNKFRWRTFISEMFSFFWCMVLVTYFYNKIVSVLTVRPNRPSQLEPTQILTFFLGFNLWQRHGFNHKFCLFSYTDCSAGSIEFGWSETNSNFRSHYLRTF